MAHKGDANDGQPEPTADRLRYDEGQAIDDRLDDIDSEDAKESFDAVFKEFEARFESE